MAACNSAQERERLRVRSAPSSCSKASGKTEQPLALKGGQGTASKSPPLGRKGRSKSRTGQVPGVMLGRHLCLQNTLSVSDSTVYRLIKFLPASVRTMLGVLDNAARLQSLINAYGGTSVCVPSGRPSSDNALTQVLGVRAMKRFMAVYGGTEVYIPRCTDFLRHLRDVEILRHYAQLQKQGFSTRKALQELCTHYALSKSRMCVILNTMQ